jgi:hypothetical protein
MHFKKCHTSEKIFELLKLLGGQKNLMIRVLNPKYSAK